MNMVALVDGQPAVRNLKELDRGVSPAAPPRGGDAAHGVRAAAGMSAATCSRAPAGAGE